MKIVHGVKQTSNRHRHPQPMPSDWERTVDRVVDCVIETLNEPPHLPGWTRARRLKEASRIVRRAEGISVEPSNLQKGVRAYELPSMSRS